MGHYLVGEHWVMVYFFSEVFFIYTGQNFKKKKGHYLVVVYCASRDDYDGRSSDFCLSLPPPNGARRFLRSHVKPKSENDG
jgi:hypothetical protein